MFLTYSKKQVHEIKKFHVAVLQQQLRNVQKSMMHVQSCCFVNIKLLLLTVLVAVITVFAKILYCCDPDFLLPW